MTTSTTAATTAAIANLTAIVDRWADLDDALAARQATGWPPTMGIAALTRTAEERDAAAAERAHERSPDQLGTRPVPLDLNIVDVMTDVERILVGFVDVVASQIQRPAMSGPPINSGWTTADHGRRRHLAQTDATDVRRWRYRGHRSAAYAAAWLRARLTETGGPFRPLTDDETVHFARVSQAAAQRIDRALGTHRHTAKLDRPCPHCRGELEIDGGDGKDPAVKCTGCGWNPTGTSTTAA